MRTVFVRELCVLLRKLDIRQEAIATHLGITRTGIGSWTAGNRAIPPHHLDAFHRLVRDAIAQAQARADAPETNNGPTLLSMPPGTQIRHMLFTGLRHWELELYDTTGQLELQYATDGDTLKRYLHILPHKLNPEERTQFQRALNGIQRALRAATYINESVDEVDGRHLGYPPDGSPLEYFDRLWAFATCAEEEPGTQEE